MRQNNLAQEVRRNVPLPTVIGDDRNRFPVVACQDALDLQHIRMRLQLIEEAKTRDDAVVEVD